MVSQHSRRLESFILCLPRYSWIAEVDASSGISLDEKEIIEEDNVSKFTDLRSETWNTLEKDKDWKIAHFIVLQGELHKVKLRKSRKNRQIPLKCIAEFRNSVVIACYSVIKAYRGRSA